MRDKRSGRVILLAHCLLNQNTVVPGLVKHSYSSLVPELIDLLVEMNIGVEVLPCPEFEMFGLHREPMSKDEYEERGLRKICREIASEIKVKVDKFRAAGVNVYGVIGVSGSPSCGVFKTNLKVNREKVEVSGMGIFMEELSSMLDVPFMEWKYKDPEDSLAKIKETLSALPSKER